MAFLQLPGARQYGTRTLNAVARGLHGSASQAWDALQPAHAMDMELRTSSAAQQQQHQQSRQSSNSLQLSVAAIPSQQAAAPMPQAYWRMASAPLSTHITRPASMLRALPVAILPKAQQLQLQTVRHSGCSLRLGRAPPKVVVIEYDPEDVDTFIAVADAIEDAFPQVVVEGNEQGGGRPGSFEVHAEGIHVFSKLLSKQPVAVDAHDIIDRIVKRAKLSTSTSQGPEQSCGY